MAMKPETIKKEVSGIVYGRDLTAKQKEALQVLGISPADYDEPELLRAAALKAAIRREIELTA